MVIIPWSHFSDAATRATAVARITIEEVEMPLGVSWDVLQRPNLLGSHALVHASSVLWSVRRFSQQPAVLDAQSEIVDMYPR
jgi:hypothetical protein